MKKILLPTDFSDNALNAVFTAIKLQDKTPCNFILLHAYKPDTRNIASHQNSTRAGVVYDALYENAVNKLKEILGIIAKVSDGTQNSFSIQVVPGDLATVISDMVPKHDLDLIVMGTLGASGVKQVLLGSNTVRALNTIKNRPIIAIPKGYNFQSLGKIVFPTEYAHFFSKGQLRSLIELAKTWRSQILVFHVAQEFKLSEQQTANKDILKERLGTINHSFSKVPIYTTVAEAISDFADEQSADMICLIHYSHTFMEKLTQEPVVKKIGFHTEKPLLVLPE